MDSLVDILDINKLSEEINSCEKISDLEAVKTSVFGKNGSITKAFKELKSLEEEAKKQRAQVLNSLKEQAISLIENKNQEITNQAIELSLQKEKIDVSLFQKNTPQGSIHPINTTIDEILSYFANLNFDIQEGPLVEDDFHNFEALNIPFYHPARDMQDTFYFRDDKLLRTHTSPVQIRSMLKQKPPLRLISPGAVFRKDFDLTHTPMFHQIEGLVVDDKNKISFANLKYILEDFLTYMFGDIKVRFRPSFFPFTEPSSEVDISCVFCQGDGCRVCSNTGWLEVLGCGIVNQKVFKSVGYKDVSGYAFGLGIERFTMLIKKIPDLRILFEGDLRLLGQFR